MTELYSANLDWQVSVPILSGRRLGPYEILSAIGARRLAEVS